MNFTCDDSGDHGGVSGTNVAPCLLDVAITQMSTTSIIRKTYVPHTESVQDLEESSTQLLV